jgi:hypothetical protein
VEHKKEEGMKGEDVSLHFMTKKVRNFKTGSGSKAQTCNLLIFYQDKQSEKGKSQKRNENVRQ